MESTEMGMFDSTAQQILLNKLDYEIWLLDFLANRQDMFEGGTDISMIKVTSDACVNIICDITEYTGAEAAQSIMDAMAPLTFTASFKMIDMIFEWILEENLRAENILKVPWPFNEKLRRLTNNPKIQFPPLFSNHKYLHTYSMALYCQLVPYRNEIVHNNNFSISKDTLTLKNSKNGDTLIFSRVQLGCIVRFVIALVRALAGIVVIDTHIDKLLRYHLDVIAMVHQLPPFGQPKPLLVHVELTVLKCGDSFPANLKQVRDNVRSIHPGKDVGFNLTVLAVDRESLIAKWYFAAEEVPASDLVVFDNESFKMHRLK